MWQMHSEWENVNLGFLLCWLHLFFMNIFKIPRFLTDSDLHHMKLSNQTQLSEFCLLGFSEDLALQPITFGLFLSMYVICVIGNLLIMLAILSDPHLHMPMYFFLSNLSVVDICFTTTTIPKMLVNIHKQNGAISYAGCLAQMFFFIISAELDNFLLVVMAYDRFVAICHPLHYMVIMNPQLCAILSSLWLVLCPIFTWSIPVLTQPVPLASPSQLCPLVPAFACTSR